MITEQRLNSILNSILDSTVRSISDFFKSVAGNFGYPENPGMPYVYKGQSTSLLPRHYSTGFPPKAVPETLVNAIIGTFPSLNLIDKHIYENPDEGFYNFYIQDYQNVWFLPNWLSIFLQVHLNFCLDIRILEQVQESLFLAILLYYQVYGLRMLLHWYIIINPYTVPWVFLVGYVDWIEDATLGILPNIAGVNVVATLAAALIGKVGDSLNHLVLTMPFLPTEGEKATILINEQPTKVLIFRYLPSLWYRYPIPNDIRQFWYEKRPDILLYMQESYQGLGIQFLPDKIVEQIKSLQTIEHLEQVKIDYMARLFSNQSLHDFITIHGDKLI